MHMLLRTALLASYSEARRVAMLSLTPCHTKPWMTVRQRSRCFVQFGDVNACDMYMYGIQYNDQSLVQSAEKKVYSLTYEDEFSLMVLPTWCNSSMSLSVRHDDMSWLRGPMNGAASILRVVETSAWA